MNIIQINYHLEYLIKKLSQKNQEEIKSECLKIVHKYSMFMNGNKNHLKDFDDKKITIYGLLDQLFSDISNTIMMNQGISPVSSITPAHIVAPALPVFPQGAAPAPLPAPLPGAAPAPLPAPGPMNVPVVGLNHIQELFSDLCKIAYF